MLGKKTNILILVAFALALVALVAVEARPQTPNNFGNGGFGKGGFGKGGFGKRGGGQNNGGKQNNGGNNGGAKNIPSNICDVNNALTIADGTQQANKNTCVKTEMGQLPVQSKMTSSMIISPADRSVVQANKPFPVKIAVAFLTTGFFSDAAKQYYTSSQSLDGNGIIQGHSHITIQQVNPGQTNPADASVFAFFEGLNDPAQNGVLSTTCPGLAPGFYRACSMSSSFTHQPVLMPVAKRGAQDDCVRFTVK